MQVAACMAKKVLENKLPEKTLLNINVPSGETYNTIQITKQGRRLWQNAIQETLDPWGNTRYWIGGGTPLTDPQQDTDVYVFAAGNVSITPIQQKHDLATEAPLLKKNDGLVDILSQMNLGDEIPENLYRAIAEVIAFAYILTGKFPNSYRP